MALEFKLPDIGEGIAEAEIVEWKVSEGDSVDEHQPIVEVMTDKATVEIPAPQAGRITEIRAKAGDTVPVGQVLFVLEDKDGAAAKDDGGGAKGKAKAAKPERAPSRAETKPERAPSRAETKPERASAREEPKPERAPAREEPKPERAPAREEPSSEPAAPLPSGGGGSTLEFKLPDIGEGIAEGEIVQWLVKEGQAVEEHEPVVEVMTDKATVEIPAPAAGTISSIRVKAGDVVPIGTVLFTLAREGRSAPAPARAAAPSSARTAAPRQPRSAAPASTGRDDEKVLAVPSARRRARELGVDLRQVSGSGRNGVIRRADVEAFSEEGAGAPATAPAAARGPSAGAELPAAGTETRTPFRGVRRKIAEAMARSKSTAAHFTVVEELDVTDLVKLRAKAKAIGEEQGVKVTYMPFLMKATASALARYPDLNSQLDVESQEIVTYGHVNLGIATDTPQGLIVPVIRDVRSKGLLQLASELQELAERTRGGKVRPDELHGGTFTITNAGNLGGILATPIINFPEVGILGVHRIVKRPGVVETDEGDQIAVRQYMNLSISVDHRLVDGATAVRFLVHMKNILENPGLLSL